MMGSSAPAVLANSPAELVEINESDLPEVFRFIARQSHEAEAGVEARLRWLVLENPARESATPLGWGLRASTGAFVGCILCVPQKFRSQQQEFVLMGSTSFYVDEAYRGRGGLVFLRYSQLNRRWALFGNSANAEAAQLWKARGAIPVGHSDHELLGVIRWRPLIEDLVLRNVQNRGLARLASGVIAPLVSPLQRPRTGSAESGELLPLASANQVMNLPLSEVGSKITAVRDLPYIRWRYFSGRDASVAAFAFRSRKLDKDILVTVNQRNRGRLGQLRTLNVLDVYPEVTPLWHAAIVSALLRRYRESVDAVVLRGQDADRQRVFREMGFVRRGFEAPNAWFLDRFSLIPRCEWYLVPADGDWLI